jgi:sensor histidine kinase YesM
MIPPTLFLTFAENAFKHGRRKVSNPGIEFKIRAEEDYLLYIVKNYILREPHNNHKGEGIGLQNTRRRLELLYPGSHKLVISNDNEKHEVRLELKCKRGKNGKK